MPLPLLLIGAALAVGGVGVKKGVDARRDFSRAKDVTEDANRIYQKAQRSLNSEREHLRTRLEALGEAKLTVYNEGLVPFHRAFSKIKNVDLSDLDIDHVSDEPAQEMLRLEESVIGMAEVAGGGAAALGSGALAGLAAFGSVGALGTASTGAAIAGLSGVAATNATLAWLGGGSLAAGGMGMTAGFAVLGGIVAAPVLLVGGLALASKAEAAVEHAKSNLLKAEAASETMQTAEVAARASARMADNVNKTLGTLLERYLVADVESLMRLVQSKQDYTRFERTERDLVARAASLAVTARNLMDTPLLEEDGRLTKAIRGTLRRTEEFLDRLRDM